MSTKWWRKRGSEQGRVRGIKRRPQTDIEQPDWMEAWQIRAEQTHYTWSQWTWKSTVRPSETTLVPIANNLSTLVCKHLLHHESPLHNSSQNKNKQTNKQKYIPQWKLNIYFKKELFLFVIVLLIRCLLKYCFSSITYIKIILTRNHIFMIKAVKKTKIVWISGFVQVNCEQLLDQRPLSFNHQIIMTLLSASATKFRCKWKWCGQML